MTASLFTTLRDRTPLNTSTSLVLALAGALLMSYERDDQILDLALWLLVGVIALMSLIVIAEALYVRRWCQRQGALAPRELEVGQEGLTGLSVPLLGPTALTHVTLTWVEPTPLTHELIATSQGLEELVSVARRGRLSEVERVVKVEDLFGFCSVSWRWRQQADLTVYPKSVSVSAAPLQQLQEGDELYDPQGHPEGDKVELRRYQEGDPLKLVVWRLYARSRQLMVRTPERALSLKRDLVAYVLTDPTDEPSASTARAYLERGLLGEDFELYADGCSGGAKSAAEALEHLLASARGEPLDALPQLLALPAQRQRSCVVFCSAATPLERLLTLTRALSAPPLVVMSFPEASAPEPRGTLERLLFKEEVEALWQGSLSAPELAQRYQTLLSEGVRVALISQPEGRAVSEFELHKMAESA